MRNYLKNSLVFILGLIVITGYGQEYDDLYFTKEDRVKKKKKTAEMIDQPYQEDKSDEELSFLGRQYQYPALEEGNVSEESLDYYKPEKTQEDYYFDNDYATQQNQNFSNPQDTYDYVDQQPVIINNYYNDNWNTWNRWNRPGLRFGMGWNNWGGNFWSVSYGNAWGYDPFWDPWYFNSWGPAWGWNNWGWNSWGWRGGFNSYWCPPGYYGNYGYGRPIYVVSDRYRGRDVTRGARPSRGSVSARESRSSSGRRSVASESSRSDQVNFSRQQADYLNRSRSSRYSSETSRGSSSINSRSVNSNSSNSSSLFNNSGRSNTNTNYNRSSNTTRSRSYSPPASRSSRSSSVRSSSGSSRSSGSVSRGSSSSSRSSGSRSSSGRSSSGRRGGN